MNDDNNLKYCCENRLDPIGMVRSKEEFMRGLKACERVDCAHCPYDDVGCSPILAYDALLVIEDLERQIQSYDKYCQMLEEQKVGDGDAG